MWIVYSTMSSPVYSGMKISWVLASHFEEEEQEYDQDPTLSKYEWFAITICSGIILACVTATVLICCKFKRSRVHNYRDIEPDVSASPRLN